MLTTAGDLLLLYITCPSAEVAESLATTLLEERLVACANIVPGVVSLYAWKGEIARDAEWLLLLKTSEAAADAVAERVRALHPYENPCLLSLPVGSGLADYLDWLRDSVAPPERRSK